MRSAVLLALFLAAGCDPTSSTDAGTDVPVLDAPGLDVPATTDAPITADSPATIDAPIAADVPADAPACPANLDSIRAYSGDLLFLSEGDFPIVVAVFPGEGDAAPTEADVVRLAMPEVGSTTGVEATDRWWIHMEINPSVVPLPPDTRPADLRAAVEAQLTDPVYVRVTEPSNPFQIQVFLVGRACGDLVWLRSTSIET